MEPIQNNTQKNKAPHEKFEPITIGTIDDHGPTRQRHGWSLGEYPGEDI